MKKYAIIHATCGAVAPLKNAILAKEPDAVVTNFVNEEMLQYVNRNGSVDATALRMFARTLFAAIESQPSAIMIGCNVYAPFIDKFTIFTDVPMLTVDAAMQEKAALSGKKLGIMGTNGRSVPSCYNSIKKIAEAKGLPAPEYVNGTVLEAASASGAAFDDLLTQRAKELVAEGCEMIILGQLTMARAKAAMVKAGITVPILTTPEEGAASLIAASGK